VAGLVGEEAVGSAGIGAEVRHAVQLRRSAPRTFLLIRMRWGHRLPLAVVAVAEEAVEVQPL
jgi:hypothetical protein